MDVVSFLSKFSTQIMHQMTYSTIIETGWDPNMMALTSYGIYVS